MTNDFINYGNVISLGMDCNKQLFTVMRNIKCAIKGDSFWPTKKKKVTDNILMKPTPGPLVKET